MEKATCSCGDVVVIVKGAPLNSRICHCLQCQKTMGSPSFARVLFEQKDISIVGPVKSYRSSSELERLFCKRCGTTIGAKRTDGSVMGVSIVLFDNRDIYPPTEHTWVSEKLSWDRVDDGVVTFPKEAVSSDKAM